MLECWDFGLGFIYSRGNSDRLFVSTVMNFPAEIDDRPPIDSQRGLLKYFCKVEVSTTN